MEGRTVTLWSRDLAPTFADGAFHFTGFREPAWDLGRKAITPAFGVPGALGTPTLRNVRLREATGLLPAARARYRKSSMSTTRVVVAPTLLRRRIAERFTHDKSLKSGLFMEQIGLVLAVSRQIEDGFVDAANAMREALRPRPCSIVGGLLTDLLRSRAELTAENVVLRQQLVAAAQKVKRPVFQPHERGLITLLTAVLPRWGDALLLVRPGTVLRWHRKGFRLLWRWKSEPTKPLAPRVSPDIVELISATVGSAS